MAVRTELTLDEFLQMEETKPCHFYLLNGVRLVWVIDPRTTL